MSARQTEAGQSLDGVCATDGVVLDSDMTGSADFVCGHSWSCGASAYRSSRRYDSRPLLGVWLAARRTASWGSVRQNLDPSQ